MNSIMYDTYTIFWRELKRYKKSRSGVLIRLIQPAIWIIVVGNIKIFGSQNNVCTLKINSTKINLGLPSKMSF